MDENDLLSISDDEGFTSVIDISTSNIPLFWGYGDSPVTVKCKKELITEFVIMCYLFRFPTAVRCRRKF